MALKKSEKKEIIKNFEEKISRAKSIVFTKFFGIGANDINELRNSLKSQNSEYLVVKKTLMSKAFEKSGLTGVDIGNFSGEVASAFGYEDEVAPAKILDEFAKTHASMEFLGGILEQRFMDAAQVKSLAKLPSKTQLYGQLVNVINAPVSGFVNVLAGNLRGLVTALNAIAEKK